MENTFILRTALKSNGFFSICMGILTLTLANTVKAISEMANGLHINFAIQMFIFGAVVLYAAFRKKISRILVWVIIVLDFLYVAIEAINLAFAKNLSSGGFALILATNILVLLFAIFQTKGILDYTKSMKKSDS